MVADIVCASEATQLQVEEDKKQCKAKAAQDMGECPKKQGQANTTGLLIAEALTSRVEKALKVCTYCTKQGELPHFYPFYLW